jgi:uncharacterized LabA/DUF88 family protein
MMDRVEIFVDGSNFFNGLKQQFGNGHCDFQKLVARILAGRQLVCFNYYTGTVHPGHHAKEYAKQKAFLAGLKRLPFAVNVYTRPLQYISAQPTSPPKEKGIDARIVQDLIMGALNRRFDVAILLSGDQDFRDVIQLITASFAVKMETFYPASRRHLFEACRDCFAKAEVIDRSFYHSIR